MSWWAWTVIVAAGFAVVALAATAVASLVGRMIATPDDDELDDEGRWVGRDDEVDG